MRQFSEGTPQQEGYYWFRANRLFPSHLIHIRRTPKRGFMRWSVATSPALGYWSGMGTSPPPKYGEFMPAEVGDKAPRREQS